MLAGFFERTIWTCNQTLDRRQPDEQRGGFSMRYIINSTSTRTQGWQADCWNWAKANEPFELYGVETQHLPFCQELSEACRCKYQSRQAHDEAVVMFDPSFETEQ
jgi:hypothetical protein